MRPDNRTAAGPGAEMNIEWLASPARVFSHPRDVLDHPGLEPSEKRAILASWASDARVVENEPTLRQVDCSAVVSLADILAALRKLDGDQPQSSRWFTGGSGARPSLSGRRAILLRR